MSRPLTFYLIFLIVISHDIVRDFRTELHSLIIEISEKLWVSVFLIRLCNKSELESIGNNLNLFMRGIQRGRNC